MAKMNYSRLAKQWTQAKGNALQDAKERIDKSVVSKSPKTPKNCMVVNERAPKSKRVESHIVPIVMVTSRNGGNTTYNPIYVVHKAEKPAYEPWQMRKAIYHGKVSDEKKVTYKPNLSYLANW